MRKCTKNNTPRPSISVAARRMTNAVLTRGASSTALTTIEVVPITENGTDKYAPEALVRAANESGGGGAGARATKGAVGRRNEVVSIQTALQLHKQLAFVQKDEHQHPSHDKHDNHVEANSASAALAIWLGILIDRFPESIVIGSLCVSPEGIQLSFIVGVFLANMPEAISSAVAMRNAGMSVMKIFVMW